MLMRRQAGADISTARARDGARWPIVAAPWSSLAGSSRARVFHPADKRGGRPRTRLCAAVETEMARRVLAAWPASLFDDRKEPG